MLTFNIEQVAVPVPSHQSMDEAIEIQKMLGFTEWHRDIVVARGSVHGKEAYNIAELAFNYQIIPGKEFELIKYISGDNWLQHREISGALSHFGTHVNHEELNSMIVEMHNSGIRIAQEVYTQSHTNENIKDSRRYHYVIFDSYKLLGYDLKLIERIDI